MTKLLTLRINGTTIKAAAGDVLLDAALINGVDIPHDCRSGQCGTCRVRIHSGHTLGGESAEPDRVHACQARVFSDLDIGFEYVPPVLRVRGRLAGLRSLGADALELKVRLDAALEIFPGQYCRITFHGFPARSYSPTVALDGADQPLTFRLHVKRIAGGTVSPQLGRSIRAGHALDVEGPFGTAYFRAQQPGRLVLLASGTGFAPVWAIADAALSERFDRPMTMIAGARALPSFYMGPALARMAHCPGVRVIALTEEWQDRTAAVQQGRPEEFVHLIGEGDIVHVAGAPRMVGAVAKAASLAGASIHADPFLPSSGAASDSRSLRLMQRLGALNRIRASPQPAPDMPGR